MDYHRQREGAIRFYQSMRRLLTQVFQSRLPALGEFRDIGFPLTNRLPWLRRDLSEEGLRNRASFEGLLKAVEESRVERAEARAMLLDFLAGQPE